MRKIVLILYCFLFVGCVSSNPNISKLNSLTPGISKAELAAYLDGQDPISTDLIDEYYLLKYKLASQHDIRGFQPYYFVFNQNGDLLGWEEVKDQKKISVSGISIAIPFPS